MASQDLSEVLRGYYQRGWRPLLLRRGEKVPIHPDWADRPPSLEELLARADGGYNVGILLGTPSGGLVDVDLDCPEARKLAPEFLPLTGAIFGRRGAPGSHWLYVCDPLPPSMTFAAPDGPVLVEVRAERHQTMFPPSVHPSGEMVRWEREWEPARVPGEVLAWGVRRLAAAALLARSWPVKGSREYAALALAGTLVRLGWEAEEIAHFVGAVAAAAGDEEASKRRQAALDTVNKYRAGGEVTGRPRLEGLLGDEVVRRVLGWLETGPGGAGGARGWLETKPPGGDYEFTPEGIVWFRRRDNVVERVLLTNFTAIIDEVAVVDDGATTQRVFVLSGRVGDTPLPTLHVPAGEFSSLAWVSEWSPRAVVAPGPAIRDRVRHAIELASQNAPQRLVYAHTGWRQVNGHWLFLHADGALGAAGPVDGVGVELPKELARYRLVVPADDKALRAAVAAVFKELPAAFPDVYAPLLGAITTAPLASFLEVDTTVWVCGPTGLFKTSTISALLNFYGDFPPGTVPAGFESTANYLEKLAFLAKDLPLLVDDARPPTTPAEAADWRHKTGRLVRAVGNRTGRGRLAGDTNLRPTCQPQALVIATSEDEPRGESTLSRTLLVRFTPGTVDPAQLSRWQQDPRPLQLAGAGYIRWLAARLNREGPEGIRRLRDRVAFPRLSPRLHPRLAATVRNLLTGLAAFAQFGLEIGAVDEGTVREWLKTAARNLVKHAEATGRAIQAQNPAHLFIMTLGDLLAAGRAHLASKTGDEAPPRAEAFGIFTHAKV